MHFKLNNVIPAILADRPSVRISGIWGQAIEWKKGDFIKITAPSGTGKTTLVHLLYGLRKDYSGEVLYEGKNIQLIDSSELANLRQLHWSIVFQDLRLFPNLTARENIELKRVLQNPIVRVEQIEEMASQLGILSILDQQSMHCSYGEQQRVSILRALMQPFDFIILDEPFSHLDNANKKIAAALIEAECKKRSAGLIITDLDKDEHFDYQVSLNL
ncbi:ATP-binding cassette domain-containing protein [Sediminibacterium sp.]|uniref:ATP-binding cassette domain-containing protein n=1 Tax=Sediminibacterium sp. TaxID=1917865 RepID=UPI0027324CCF|nr:ATP-binding cassette domain-containing protein [Sediminibacterium sp.]MDP3393398.1 ATP-binding cassette domain-containing protein [Sediminibacterium sp.]MDP3568000.1 ATP-binding cassette domain-containing protein [Sediminibacterium sp.]